MAKGKKNLHGRLLCGAAAIALLSWSSARAQDAKFDIAPQPLDTALREFGVQSGVTIMADAHDTRAKQSPGFSATADPETALKQLLAGTGLSYRRSGDVFVVGDASDPQSSGAAGDGAEGTVQALIVTAQKREEDIQDVPIAISAFTQEDLTRSQVAGGPDLMTQVPNFTFTKTNFSGYSIQIRGIGTQAISATTDPAVAVAFNNTPFIRNRFFEQEFYDIERVEVLRGPQGTLYGRNATAGVVNIISAKPKNHFEAKASADVANYSTTRLEGMLNLPLVADKVALRIAGAWTKRDGYVKNLLTGQQIDGRDLWSTRVTLGLTPTDRFTANFIWEHFEENDDRLRSGKQLCHRDAGPTEINGTIIYPSMGYPLYGNLIGYFTQGCLPASLYSPDSFEVPNGFALPYGPAAILIGSPVADVDTYANATQSRNLREIETYLKPEYTATNDTVELQLKYDISDELTLASETGFGHDQLFSFEDYNRFATRPHTITTPSGVVCSYQIGCSDRMQAGDLSTARSQHFSQEFRLSSSYAGPFNFNIGANFLRYDTEDKYYVFINTLAWGDVRRDWCDYPVTPDNDCREQLALGYEWVDPNRAYSLFGSQILDRGNIHHLNDLGRNYFLSKNPYNLKSYAVFGEAYYQLSDNLKLTGGLRWTVDRKAAPQIPSWYLAAGSTYGIATRKTIRQEWREPTGRVAIDWRPDISFTDETLLYASYVRGYKAGGANPPPAIVVGAPVNAPFDEAAAESLTHPQTFGPEFVDAYEVGTKNTLLDGRLTFNLNAFYYDYTGYQVSQIVDRSAVNLNFDATIWGSELEVDYRPIENLRLAFKGGYENTRLTDGSKAIDLIDRAAGVPGWIVKRPFPTFPSNCVMPLDHFLSGCDVYIGSQQTWDAPNNGEGFAKDLSGNELPNAPHFTATLTGDYTIPLPSDWLVTLHSDLYYQSEAWTRVFNMPGYDKLKAYNNINLAAILTNEDAGWTVMAYVKNLLDKDSITGAFLNSDDTGLTTNVFLNEPRLYGLRVTKNWNGSEWWSARAHRGGDWYPYRLELGGDYGRTSGGREILIPATTALFPADHPYPLGVQNDLDWGSGGGVKFTYQPQPTGWSLSGGVRYGRARGSAEEHPKWSVPGGYLQSQAILQMLIQKYPETEANTRKTSYFDTVANQLNNYATATGRNEESHVLADFEIGKDVGLGSWRGADARVNFGLQYAKFRASSNADLHGRPDVYLPPYAILKYGGHWHRFWGTLDARREFEGAGPAASWEQAVRLMGDADKAGRVDMDVGLGGSVLWGKQTAQVEGNERGDYHVGFMRLPKYGDQLLENPYDTPLSYHRSRSVTVPSINANLGLSYTLGGMKVSGGYRVERYFDAIDAGIAERKTYDRQFDGPYFKVSVGFGG